MRPLLLTLAILAGWGITAPALWAEEQLLGFNPETLIEASRCADEFWQSLQEVVEFSLEPPIDYAVDEMVTVATDLRLTIARLGRNNAGVLRAQQDRVALLDECWEKRKPEPQPDATAKAAQRFEEYWYSQAVRALARAQLAETMRDTKGATAAFDDCVLAAEELAQKHFELRTTEAPPYYYEEERALLLLHAAQSGLARHEHDPALLLKNLESNVKAFEELVLHAKSHYENSVQDMPPWRYYRIKFYAAIARAELARAMKDKHSEIASYQDAVACSARFVESPPQGAYETGTLRLDLLVQLARLHYIARRALARLTADSSKFDQASEDYREFLRRTYEKVEVLYDVQAVGGEAVKLHYIRAAQMQARLNGLTSPAPAPK